MLCMPGLFSWAGQTVVKRAGKRMPVVLWVGIPNVLKQNSSPCVNHSPSHHMSYLEGTAFTNLLWTADRRGGFSGRSNSIYFFLYLKTSEFLVAHILRGVKTTHWTASAGNSPFPLTLDCSSWKLRINLIKVSLFYLSLSFISVLLCL